MVASKPRSEARIREGVRAHLLDVFPNSYIEANSPGPWGSSGRPDFELCASCIVEHNGSIRYGVYTGLELKREDYGNTPWKGLSEEQEVKLARIAKSGGLALVTNDTPFQLKVNGEWNLKAWMFDLVELTWAPVMLIGYSNGTKITLLRSSQ